MKKLARLFQIKTKVEVFLITYALGLGAAERGKAYLLQYPNFGGKLLFLCCLAAVMLAAAKMLQAVEYHQMIGTD
jgi:hypothetical protein